MSEKKTLSNINNIIFVILALSIIVTFLATTGDMMKLVRKISGKEVYITEVKIIVIPVSESPISDAQFQFSVKNYKSKIESELLNQYRTESGKEDNITPRGANISFELNLTLVNASDIIVFQNIFQFEKGYTRTIKIYKERSQMQPNTLLTVIVNISMKLELSDGTIVEKGFKGEKEILVGGV